MKKKVIPFTLLMLSMTISLVLSGCDLLEEDSSSSTTYTYYFVNYSSYNITVSIGGTTGIVPRNDNRYIELYTPVTTFTYNYADLVYCTGALTGTITFYDI